MLGLMPQNPFAAAVSGTPRIPLLPAAARATGGKHRIGNVPVGFSSLFAGRVDRAASPGVLPDWAAFWGH